MVAQQARVRVRAPLRVRAPEPAAGGRGRGHGIWRRGRRLGRRCSCGQEVALQGRWPNAPRLRLVDNNNFAMATCSNCGTPLGDDSKWDNLTLSDSD